MTFAGQPRILITGAHGFVGRHLVRRLLELLPADGTLIFADTHAPKEAPPPRCSLRTVDITDADGVEELVRSENPTHLVHLAAIAAVAQAQAAIRRAWAVNFSGVQNLALAVVEHAPACRFLFCSSAEVYGASFAGGAKLDERALLQPVSVYGAAKAAADIMLGQMARHGLKVVRMRPVNHTGPEQSTAFVVPAFAAQIARIERGECEPVLQVGDLSNARDFLDVRDVVDAYVRSLIAFDELPNGVAINVASGHARQVRSILNDLQAMSSTRINVSIDPTRLRPSDTPIVACNADLAYRLLRWHPKHAWEDTLRSVMEYWRAQPAAR
ncbi:MAG: GDP-mannose 4,6-dehydratase [Pseudomonadota bacterium]